VSVCAVGAFAMYLALRFHITREFVDFPLTNWLDNSAWYDMKILVDAYNPQRNFSKPISNNTYCKAIKKVLQELRLPSTHFVHLGRKLGSKELEMLETQGSQIDALGNWNSNNVRETRYSTKLPMEAIKNKAGFTTGEKTHYLVRQGIEVPEVLLHKTPFAFCYEAQTYVNFETGRWPQDRGLPGAAIKFLDLMCQLNVVFLQDMACIWNLHPDRREHPIFKQLEVFQMEEWKAFVELVDRTLEADREATSTQALRGVEQYVPGIMDQFAGINQRVQQQGDAINHKMQQQVDSIQALSQLVSMMSTQLPKKIHRLLDRVLKGALNGGISALGGEDEDEEDGEEEEDGLGDPEMMEATTAAAPAVPVPPARGAVNTTAVIPRPLSRYTSILELCNDYNDRFVALEASGAGWRSKVYSVAEQKHFSRVTQVFKGVEKCVETHLTVDSDDDAQDTLLTQLDKEYQDRNCSLPKMIDYLQNHGYLVKASRKRKGAPQ
jgi:Centromere DNA-binding protein complex CBF3 subunit, domain 2